MAYISITTDKEEGPMTLQERVLSSDLESELFCTHLIERLRWAVEDTRPIDLQQPGARKGGSTMEPNQQSPLSNEVAVLTAWRSQ
jgi:hypothetical protein